MIPSLNLFSSTQAVAPVGNNTKKHITTVVQFQEKNQKPLKAKHQRPEEPKKQKTKIYQMEKNKQALLGFC